MREGIECFVKIGELLGKDNLFYLGAMEGIDNKMNIEFEKYLSDPYTKEAMIAEATVLYTKVTPFYFQNSSTFLGAHTIFT